MNDIESRKRFVEPELYFLIYKFLRSGPCKKTANLILEEIEKNRLLPDRLTWTGVRKPITFNDYAKNYPHIRDDHLLRVCSYFGLILDRNIPPSVPGVPTLLGAGTQSLLRTSSKITPINKSLYLYARIHETPITPSTKESISHPANLVQTISARETTGPLPLTKSISTSLYNRHHLHKRYLGHLSSVYCVSFDRTGKYIFTGADDLLIKIWNAHSGRLLATLRGHSAEITDMAINYENTLIASGSTNRIIRIWSLRTTEPITVLTGHAKMITSVKFCPAAKNENRYMISTSNDSCLNIWCWNSVTYKFDQVPIKFCEATKPNTQLICSSFSSGGAFLAVGSSDHFVRIYHLTAVTGPTKIYEVDTHTDAVDSIQFCNRGLRFVTGSKDGTSFIWWYKRQKWRNMQLNMNERLPDTQAPEEPENSNTGKNKIRVNMVSWTCDDRYVITAVSDKSLKVWDADTGKLFHVLNEHFDESFVVEAHPLDPRIFLSCGHDGKIILWDVYAGKPISIYYNAVDNQGHQGCIYDCKFSPDGQMFASTDSHGHLAIYGFGSSAVYEKMPNDVFFHTDYRPLIRDANNFVIDEQTQCAPHLMPPPFLVDIDGNPYPPNLQRLVPGRENCKDHQLIPYIAMQNDRGVSEILEPVVGVVRPPGASPGPADGEPSGAEQASHEPSQQQEPQPSSSRSQARPTIDDMIQRIIRNEQRDEDEVSSALPVIQPSSSHPSRSNHGIEIEQARDLVNLEHGYAAPSGSSSAALEPPISAEPSVSRQRGHQAQQSSNSGRASSLRPGLSNEGSQGVRQGAHAQRTWQSREKMAVGGRIVVEPLCPGMINRMREQCIGSQNFEEDFYHRELRRKPTDESRDKGDSPGERFSSRREKKAKAAARRANNRRTGRRISRVRVRSPIGDAEVIDEMSPENDESDSDFSGANSSDDNSLSSSESENTDFVDDDDDDLDDDDNDNDSGSDAQYRPMNGHGNSSKNIARRSSRRIRSKPHKLIRTGRHRSTTPWQEQCRLLLDEIVRDPDSEPFRAPVDIIQYRDYNTIVDTPMDLQTVRHQLENDIYRCPEDFGRDMELIFKNSRSYNTKKRSPIFQMTQRLSAFFKSKMATILNNFAHKHATRHKSRRSKRRNGEAGPYGLRNKTRGSRKRPLSELDDDEPPTPVKKRKRRIIKHESSSSASVDLSQPSTSGANSRSPLASSSSSSSKCKGKGGPSVSSHRMLTRRKRIKVSSEDEHEDRDVKINGHVNGIHTNENFGEGPSHISPRKRDLTFFKSLVVSDDDTDVDMKPDIHCDSETEIEDELKSANEEEEGEEEENEFAGDTDVTEIAEDDLTMKNGKVSNKKGKRIIKRRRRRAKRITIARRKTGSRTAISSVSSSSRSSSTRRSCTTSSTSDYGQSASSPNSSSPFSPCNGSNSSVECGPSKRPRRQTARRTNFKMTRRRAEKMAEAAAKIIEIKTDPEEMCHICLQTEIEPSEYTNETAINWVSCDSCERWFHQRCTRLKGVAPHRVQKTTFICQDCDASCDGLYSVRLRNRD